MAGTSTRTSARTGVRSRLRPRPTADGPRARAPEVPGTTTTAGAGTAGTGPVSDDGVRRVLNKVPEITLYFWIIKVLATTVGETAADYLNVDLGFGLNGTMLVMSALLAVVLAVQFRSPRYIPWVYWLAVVLISVVGTLITDDLVDNLGVSLQLTTAVFAAALTATFAAWWGKERTLSIHSIVTGRREAFYWLAILFTFALGTAAGDLLAEGLSLGFARSALLFAGAIALVALAHSRLQLGAITAFWAAYVLTRPLGASIGDYLSQPRDAGGLGLGTTGTSALFLVAIAGTVAYLTVTRRDQQPLPATT